MIHGSSRPVRAGRAVGVREPTRLACVFEYAIGHKTVQANLACQMEHWPDVEPTWYRLSYATKKRWPPRWLNWTLRAGLMARAALRGAAYDALLFHTQIPALCCADHMRGAPALISMDSTPTQNARLGVYVGSSQQNPVFRHLMARWTTRVLRQAHTVVAWSHWARQSLVQEYGLSPGHVIVLPPGIDVAWWREATEAGRREGGGGSALPRILFVGGGFANKGGHVLLDCFRQHWWGRAELHLVTHASLPPEPGVFLHRELDPNSEALMRLYRDADLFVLPTFGDALPQAVMEAMASGLPVVASDVGAMREMVVHGETGLLVRPRDPTSLADAVEALLQDPALRRRMGRAGQERAGECFDIARNGRRMIELLHQAREERRT